MYSNMQVLCTVCHTYTTPTQQKTHGFVRHNISSNIFKVEMSKFQQLISSDIGRNDQCGAIFNKKNKPSQHQNENISYDV